MTLGKLVTQIVICASVTKQYNLVLAKGRRCSAVAVGSLSPGLCHLQNDCLDTGINSGPTLVSNMDSTFTFFECLRQLNLKKLVCDLIHIDTGFDSTSYVCKEL